MTLTQYLYPMFFFAGMSLIVCTMATLIDRDVYGKNSRQYRRDLAVSGLILPAAILWPLTLALLALALILAIPAGIIYAMMNSFKYFVKKEYS